MRSLRNGYRRTGERDCWDLASLILPFFLSTLHGGVVIAVLGYYRCLVYSEAVAAVASVVVVAAGAVI